MSAPQRRAPARPAGVGHGTAFWIIAFACMIALAFTAVPAPLWSIYQKQDGFSTFMITVVFAAYAVGVIISLFLAGHVSDWHGRRRVLLAGVLTEAVSALLFLLSTELPVLIVTRVVSGVGIGMVTAYLIELHGTARPGASRSRADVVATAANIGGLAVGPLAGDCWPST